MDPSAKLRRSIIVSVAVYLAVQAALYTAFVLAVRFPPEPLYYLVCALFHFALLAFLLWRKADLRRTTDGSALQGINLPCHLTLLRLSFTPTVVFLAARPATPLVGGLILAAVAVVFATDFWDGRIARSTGETTVMGAYLDSSSDYVILGAAAVAFTVLEVIPLWYALVLASRLGIHAAGMGLLSVLRGRVEPETTFLGKVGVFAAMAVAAFQLARHYGVPVVGNVELVRILEIAGAAVLLVSLVEKLLYLGRKLRSPAPPPRPG